MILYSLPENSRNNRSILILLIGLAMIGYVIFLTGCQNPTPDFPSVATSQLISDTHGKIVETGNDITAAKGTVGEMTPENLPVKKPVAVMQLESAERHNGEAATQSATAGKAAIQIEGVAKQQQAEIVTLKANDPVRTRLTIGAIVLIVMGLAGIVTSFLIPTLGAIPHVQAGSLSIFTVGVLLAIIAHFLTQIYWIGGLAILACFIGFGVWTVSHWSILKGNSLFVSKVVASFGNVVSSIEGKSNAAK